MFQVTISDLAHKISLRLTKICNKLNVKICLCRYRLAAFSGVRYIGTVTGGIEVCALIACRNDTQESCGYLYDGKVSNATVFTSVKISRSLENNFETNHSYIPDTMATDTNLISPNKFTFNIDKRRNKVTMALKKPEKHLFAFAIFGRNFMNDGKDAVM